MGKAKCKNCTDEIIEEMARVMCGNDCEECAKETAQWRGCSLKKAKAEECLIKKEAKLLYEQGYRKIKDNDLYIPEEYIEEFGNFIVTSPQMKQRVEKEIKAWQKETAKEILQSLLDFVNCEKINQGHSFEKIKETLIKVAKTYEVEVEE